MKNDGSVASLVGQLDASPDQLRGKFGQEKEINGTVTGDDVCVAGGLDAVGFQLVSFARSFSLVSCPWRAMLRINIKNVPERRV